MAGILRSAKMFLMASDWEGTPKAMLEAMACGLPIVSTDVGDCAYLVQGAGNITKDHSPASLAQSALDVLGNGKWKAYSKQAVANASRFDWSQVTDRLKAVYCKLNPGVFCE
jgi:glycosyltransferase involved in cell wall biosynthesis